MEYRELNETHLKDMATLFVKAFNTYPWNEEWTEEIAYKRLAQMISCDGFYGMVVIKDSRIVGMIFGRQEQYYNGVIFEIKEFCVDITLGIKGLGTQVYNVFENRLKEMGIKEIVLNTCRSDKTIGFYEKQGFKVSDNIVVMNKKV